MKAGQIIVMQKSFTFAEGAYKIQDDFDGCKITAFSFGFLVSCDSVSWAEENSEYINSITSEEFQSVKEQKLADEACIPTNGFYNCGFYDMKILVAINKYIKQRRPDSIMYYDPDLHEICKTHSKKWQIKSRFLI